MDEVVAVLGNMAGDGGGGAAGQLHAEAIGKLAAFPVLVVRRQCFRVINGIR